MSDYSDSPDYENLSPQKVKAVRRIANVLYQLGSDHLFLSEEIALQDREFRSLVEDCYRNLRKGLPWPPLFSHSKKIILDKPDFKYVRVIREHCETYESVYIDFLCSHISKLSHFYIVALSLHRNLIYDCLNIPIGEWHEYKKLPNYKGD